MICPQCKCEYIRGVTTCADCGVALVTTLDPQKSTSSLDNVRLVPIWRGKDTSEFERVRQVLEGAGVSFTVPDSRNSSFLPSDPMLEVWVAEADRKTAEKVISDFEDLMSPDELTSDQLESLELSESQAPQEDADDGGADSDLDQEWDEDEQVNEVWTGDVEGLADTLVACFREVGIASRKLDQDGRWHVVVRPPQEARAKEIVREVVEASPPE